MRTKVTTFEGAHATICFGGDKLNDSDVESTIRDLVRDPKKRVPGGLLVDLVGTFSPVGTQLSVDLRDSEIPVSPGSRRKAGRSTTRHRLRRSSTIYTWFPMRSPRAPAC